MDRQGLFVSRLIRLRSRFWSSRENLFHCCFRVLWMSLRYRFKNWHGFLLYRLKTCLSPFRHFLWFRLRSSRFSSSREKLFHCCPRVLWMSLRYRFKNWHGFLLYRLKTCLSLFRHFLWSLCCCCLFLRLDVLHLFFPVWWRFFLGELRPIYWCWFHYIILRGITTYLECVLVFGYWRYLLINCWKAWKAWPWQYPSSPPRSISFWLRPISFWLRLHSSRLNARQSER